MDDVLKYISPGYQKDIKKAIKLLKDSGCKEIYLFGSLIEGNHREESDIDLAIRGCHPDVYYQLIGKLMMELDYPVDLVNLDREDAFTKFLETKGDMVSV